MRCQKTRKFQFRDVGSDSSHWLAQGRATDLAKANRCARVLDLSLCAPLTSRPRSELRLASCSWSTQKLIRETRHRFSPNSGFLLRLVLRVASPLSIERDGEELPFRSILAADIRRASSPIRSCRTVTSNRHLAICNINFRNSRSFSLSRTRAASRELPFSSFLPPFPSC